MGFKQGRSQDLVSGGTHFGGGGDPLFFASDRKSQGSPLSTFGYHRISGGGPAPPGYALGFKLDLSQPLKGSLLA